MVEPIKTISELHNKYVISPRSQVGKEVGRNHTWDLIMHSSVDVVESSQLITPGRTVSIIKVCLMTKNNGPY